MNSDTFAKLKRAEIRQINMAAVWQFYRLKKFTYKFGLDYILFF